MHYLSDASLTLTRYVFVAVRVEKNCPLTSSPLLSGLQRLNPSLLSLAISHDVWLRGTWCSNIFVSTHLPNGAIGSRDSLSDASVVRCHEGQAKGRRDGTQSTQEKERSFDQVCYAT